LVKSITITALNDSKIYDGVAYFGNRGASYTGAGTNYLTGTLVYSGLSQGAINAGSYAITASGVTSNNAQYIVSYVNGSLTISKAPLSLSASTDVKVYDGTTSSTGALTVTGLKGTDTLTGASQSFTNKNVLGTDGSTLKVNTDYVIKDGNSGGNYTVLTNDAVGSMIARDLLVSTAGGNKTYDGNINAAVTLVDNRVIGDVFTVGHTSATFADKNVATSKVVNVNGVSISGVEAQNYNVSSTASGLATVERLQTVAWVGGTSGNWFDPLNWAGGAVPDLSNVANVSIPVGVNVSFNNSIALPAQAGAVHVDSIANNGALSLLAGTLNVATHLASDVLNQSGGVVNGTGDISVNSLNQTGGSILSAGDLRVNQSFVQSAEGRIAVGGNILIAQSTGNLEVNHLSGQLIDVSATQGTIQLGDVTARGPLSILANGNITQTVSGSINAAGGSVITSRTGDITLANLSNDQDGLIVLTGRNITFSDSTGPTLILDATGNSTLNSGGNMAVSGVTNDLNTTTYNGGSTSFGATTVNGNLAINSAGTVSQTNAVTVNGTASIITAAQDLTSILADKAFADAAAAKIIADAAAAKVLSDAAAAKTLADAASAAAAKVIADAAAAKVIADAAAAKTLADAASAAEAKAIADAAAAKALANAASVPATNVISDAALVKAFLDSKIPKVVNDVVKAVETNVPFDSAVVKAFAEEKAAQLSKNLANANTTPNNSSDKLIDMWHSPKPLDIFHSTMAELQIT